MRKVLYQDYKTHLGSKASTKPGSGPSFHGGLTTRQPRCAQSGDRFHSWVLGERLRRAKGDGEGQRGGLIVCFGRSKLDGRGLHMKAFSLIWRKFLQSCLVIDKYWCCYMRVKVASIYQKGVYMYYLPFQCC